MNFRMEINADGADVRGVSGEISGTLAERERQLRDLFRLGKQLGRDYTAFEQVNPAVPPAIDDFFSKIPSNLQLPRNLG